MKDCLKKAPQQKMRTKQKTTEETHPKQKTQTNKTRQTILQTKNAPPL